MISEPYINDLLNQSYSLSIYLALCAVCVCVCAHACVRACMRVCVIHLFLYGIDTSYIILNITMLYILYMLFGHNSV